MIDTWLQWYMQYGTGLQINHSSKINYAQIYSNQSGQIFIITDL